MLTKNRLNDILMKLKEGLIFKTKKSENIPCNARVEAGILAQHL